MSDSHKIIDQLAAAHVGSSPEKTLWLEVAKFGRCDRFILRARAINGRPYRDVADYQPESAEETLEILKTLDGLLKTDPTFVLLYASGLRREIKGYCFWYRITGLIGNIKEPLVAPLYARRILEQKRILDGKIKRGHMAFGFWPLEGFS
jgi:hypothetical protein